MTVIQGGVCDIVIGLIFLCVYAYGAFGGGSWNCYAMSNVLGSSPATNFSADDPISPDCVYESSTTTCYVEGTSDPASKPTFAPTTYTSD